MNPLWLIPISVFVILLIIWLALQVYDERLSAETWYDKYLDEVDKNERAWELILEIEAKAPVTVRNARSRLARKRIKEVPAPA